MKTYHETLRIMLDLENSGMNKSGVKYCLRGVISKILEGRDSGKILDINGNTVGSFATRNEYREDSVDV